MTDSSATHDRPWHLWVVALTVGALYAIGARDYLLILFGDTGYIEGEFGTPGLEYFTDYPLGLRFVWTVNIGGGLLAALLLVARSRWALPAAAAATGAQVLLLVLTFVFRDRWAMLGPTTAWVDISVAVVTAAFTAYCAAMRPRPRPPGG